MRQLFRLDCPSINTHDVIDRTALYSACCCGYEAIVRELLAHGADVIIRTELRLTPLLIASYFGRIAIVCLCEVLGIDLAAAAAPNLKDKYLTALDAALWRGRDEVAAFLSSRARPALRVIAQGCVLDRSFVFCFGFTRDLLTMPA